MVLYHPAHGHPAPRAKASHSLPGLAASDSQRLVLASRGALGPPIGSREGVGDPSAIRSAATQLIPTLGSPCEHGAREFRQVGRCRRHLENVCPWEMGAPGIWTEGLRGRTEGPEHGALGLTVLGSISPRASSDPGAADATGVRSAVRVSRSPRSRRSSWHGRDGRPLSRWVGAKCQRSKRSPPPPRDSVG
jgi:hypothetical protein